MKNNQNIPKSSSLYSFVLPLESNDVIQLSVRLDNTNDLGYDAKHPILLDASHPITILIISVIHDK